MGLPQTYGPFMPPLSKGDKLNDPNAITYDTLHSGLARFLEQIEWEFSNGNKIELGRTLFVDLLPKYLYSEDADRYPLDEDVVAVVLTPEPVGTPGRTERFEHKVATGVIVNVYAGHADRCNSEAMRLYHFLLQRTVAFSTETIRCDELQVLSEPGLVGVEDSGWVNYSFRTILRGVRPYLRQ